MWLFKCQIESLFVEFRYIGMVYSIGGIYRHPSGNVSHFVSAVELLLNMLNALAGRGEVVDLRATRKSSFFWG